MFNFKKKKETVEFLDIKDMLWVIRPLSIQACDVVLESIDRYIDSKMKDVVEKRINTRDYLPWVEESEMRGVLDFRKFFAELMEKKENQ